MNKSNISNYIIIDDDSDMLLHHAPHFIHCPPTPRSTSGFNEKCYEKALKVLSSTIIDLHYDN
jgi:5'-3' exonuclease